MRTSSLLVVGVVCVWASDASAQHNFCPAPSVSRGTVCICPDGSLASVYGCPVQQNAPQQPQPRTPAPQAHSNVGAAAAAVARMGNAIENSRTNVWGDERVSQAAARNSDARLKPAGFDYTRRTSPAQALGNTSSNIGSVVTNSPTNIWSGQGNTATNPKPDVSSKTKEQSLYERWKAGVSTIKQDVVDLPSNLGKAGKAIVGGGRETQTQEVRQSSTNSGASVTSQKSSGTKQQQTKQKPANYQSVGTGTMTPYGEVATMAPADTATTTKSTKNNSKSSSGTYYGSTSTGFGR